MLEKDSGSSNDSYIYSSNDSGSESLNMETSPLPLSLSEESGSDEMSHDIKYESVHFSLEWIFDRLTVLKDVESEGQIGTFDLSNKDFKRDVIYPLSNIRKNNAPDDYESIMKEVLELIEKDSFLKSFSNLRGIYEFIIHMHNEYEVKIDATMTEEKDCVLRETMENVMGKLTISF